MNTSPELTRFVGETHAFAIQLMRNAAYIQKELPSLDMPDSLREQITTLCSDLIGSKHDLISEATELEEAMDEGANPDRISRRVKMILEWVQNDVSSIHGCVSTVRDAVEEGTTPAIVSVLITESATNILNVTPSFPEPDPSRTDAEEDDDGEEEDPNADCYGFYCEDSYPIGQLIDAISMLMERPGQSPEALEQLRAFLFAMERLPMMTPGFRMALGLRLDYGGESDWIEIRMEEDAFTLGRGSWIEGDAGTETVFEVGPDYRDGDTFMASEFAQSFQRCSEDLCREIVIEDSSGQPSNSWPLERDKRRWAGLPSAFL